MCETVKSKVLGKGGEVNRGARLGSFSLDKVNEVEDSVIDD